MGYNYITRFRLCLKVRFYSLLAKGESLDSALDIVIREATYSAYKWNNKKDSEDETEE